MKLLIYLRRAFASLSLFVGGARRNRVIPGWWHGDPFFDHDTARVRAFQLEAEDQAAARAAFYQAWEQLRAANARVAANSNAPEANHGA